MVFKNRPYSDTMGRHSAHKLSAHYHTGKSRDSQITRNFPERINSPISNKVIGDLLLARMFMIIRSAFSRCSSSQFT